MDGGEDGGRLMQKRRPNGSGVDLRGGDRSRSTKSRHQIKATPAQRARLQALLWTVWALGGARP